jgi:phage repressor protein C with HTH and peptisase S24 domain
MGTHRTAPTGVKDNVRVETIGQRVKRLRAGLHLTQAQVAKRANLSQVTISDIETGRNRASRDLPALAEALETTSDYLATGRGESKSLSESRKSVAVFRALSDHPNPITVRIESGAMGLFSKGVAPAVGVDAVEVSREWLTANVPGLQENSQVVLIPCFDDSMVPTFGRGDTLFLDASVRELTADGVYAFRGKGDFFVKRLQVLPTGGVRVISDNKDAYQPYLLNPEERKKLDIRGRVIYTWSGRRL